MRGFWGATLPLHSCINQVAGRSVDALASSEAKGCCKTGFQRAGLAMQGNDLSTAMEKRAERRKIRRKRGGGRLLSATVRMGRPEVGTASKSQANSSRESTRGTRAWALRLRAAVAILLGSGGVDEGRRGPPGTSVHPPDAG